MRIACIGDSHFDSSAGGRLNECVTVHDWICSDLARRGVDVILHAGDLFERKSTPADRNAAATWLQRCAAIAPVVVVRGNHDVPGDLRIMGELEAKHPIRVSECPQVDTVAGIAIGSLPWPRKAELLAQLDRDASLEQAGEVAQEALRDVLRGIGSEMRTGCPRLLLAHAQVRGCVTSTGQPLVGHDMELGLEDLALAGADIVLLGHIHKAQSWEWNRDNLEVPIVYTGSPRRTAYGESEPKGYVLVEFEQRADGRWGVSWERVETPAQAMVLLEDESVDGCWRTSMTDDQIEQLAGSDVRFRYEVASDQREAARAAAEEVRRELVDQGAERVKVEECLRPTTRSRTADVAEATTTAAKLQRLWKVRGEELGAREPRVLGRLAEIEDEGREA